jgi:hypothetical protein
MSPYLLQSNTEIESIAAVLETNPENCLPGTIDNANGEETGGIDDLLNTEGALLMVPRLTPGASHDALQWSCSQKGG